MSKNADSGLTIIKICPATDELEGVSEYYCPETSCAGLKFNKEPNLEMHLVRRHIFPPTKSDPNVIRQFYCPVSHCQYHMDTGKDKHFTARKYVKQHYQKVHAKKLYDCLKCSKKFSTIVLKENHERTCGHYQCPSCPFSYKSKESLVSHIRRNHNGGTKGTKSKRPQVVTPLQSTVEIGVQTASPTFLDGNVEMATQYEDLNGNKREDFPNANLIDNYCQTIDVNGYFEDSFGSCFNPTATTSSSGAVSSIETQTDILEDLIQSSATLISEIYSNDRHTQTCDEILSELLVNDMLVSTETQTGLLGDLNPSIQTQTIDAFFGAPSMSVSSTHTQT